MNSSIRLTAILILPTLAACSGPQRQADCLEAPPGYYYSEEAGGYGRGRSHPRARGEIGDPPPGDPHAPPSPRDDDHRRRLRDDDNHSWGGPPPPRSENYSPPTRVDTHPTPTYSPPTRPEPQQSAPAPSTSSPGSTSHGCSDPKKTLPC